MRNKSVYLIYDTVNCMPNGDPDTGEQRYNDATKRAVVSDVRIKRFGRDQLIALGFILYYMYDKSMGGVTNKTGSYARFVQFCKENNIKVDENNLHIMIQHFLDVRVMGGILTSEKDKANITGALQFEQENESINEVVFGENLISRGLTTVFPSKDEKKQGSMGKDSILKYGLFCIKGRYSATTALINNTNDEELKLVLSAISVGIDGQNTRSKYGHEHIATVVVEHPTRRMGNGFLGKMLGKSFSPFNIVSNKKSGDFFSRNDYEFDFSPLWKKTETNEVEAVSIYCGNDDVIEKYFSNLNNKCEIINPLDVLLNH